MTERMETVATSPATIQWPFERGQSAKGHHKEKNFIEALRAGNEQAFEALLERLSPSMLGVARSILCDREMAAEVVQETWLAAIRGLERFEGRSSLKTWIFSILTNVARTRAKRERRTVAFSSLSEIEGPADKLAAAAERFSDDRHAWMSPPRRWKQTPEDRLLSREAVAMIRKALQLMPPRQAEVVTLRDIEGWSAEEVCQALGLTEANQKVLLHRGRTRVRNALEHHRSTKRSEKQRDNRIKSFVKPKRIALKTLRVIVLAILLPLIRAADLTAKTNDKQFDRISIEQGLSQTTVYCILQDARGFMWFGTRDGLNKYDGYNFTVYKQEPDNPNSLSNNTVRALYEDRSGTLWVGTDGGLNKFDRGRDRFTRYKTDPNDPHSLSNDRVRAIVEDQSGVLWIGTYGGGLNKVVPIDRGSPGSVDEGVSPTFVPYQHDPSNPASLSHNNVYTMYKDRTGTLWIGTIGGGLNKLDRGEGVFTRYRHDPNDPASLSHDDVNAIYEDRSGVLWIGTRGGGLDKLIPPAQSPSDSDKEGSPPTFAHYRHQPNNPNSLSHDNVNAIHQDESGILWIGTYGGGLNEIVPPASYSPGASGNDDDRSPLTFARYRHDPVDPSSLSHDLIRSIYEDRSGVLWVGTSEGGLNQFDRRKRKFTHYESEPNNPDSLSTSSVSSIYEDRRGDIWVGTYGGGLNKLVRGDGEGSDPAFVHYRRDPNDPHSLSNDVVYSIYQDRSGVIWLGTIDGGLNRFTPPAPSAEGHPSQVPPSFTHYRHDPDDPSSLSNDRVMSILEDPEEVGRVLWIGTYGGLNRFDRATGVFSHYKHDPKDPASLSHDEINVIYEDRSDVLWIGTRGGGLNRFDREKNLFTRYLHDASDPNSLSHNEINAIHESHGEPGALWIGTHGGLNKLVPSTSPRDQDLAADRPGKATFVHYGEKGGLPNDVILGILEDDDGHLWLSTYRGISKFDPRTATFKNYDVQDGLQSNEFNLGAHHRGDSGRMFFGGINGFNAFYPDRLRDDPRAPPIVITDFQIFNQQVRIANRPGANIGRRRAYTLQQHITETTAIVLSYKESVFSFEFAALHYSRPEKKRYAYKMEGFDEHWVDSGTRRFATYTNLDPGKYIFRVKGSNRDAVWNEEGAVIDITITPPFWQTWWFRTVAAATILALAVGWYRRRIRNIEVQKEQLEIQVEEKTREIRETQDQLVQSEKLAALGRLTAGIAHEINTPIGAIKSSTDIATRCVAKLEEAWGKVKALKDSDDTLRFLDILKENNRISSSASDRIADLVNNLKAFTRLDEAEFGKVDIHEGLDSAHTLIRHEIKDGIQVAKEYGEIPEIYCYASELNQVFMTLLRNAVEAIEGEGMITLRTSVDKNKVRVEISDSGKGVPVERLKSLFDFNFTTNGARVAMGMDLVNAYNIVQNHRGELKAETEVGRGSTFTIILPTDLEKISHKRKVSSTQERRPPKAAQLRASDWSG